MIVLFYAILKFKTYMSKWKSFYFEYVNDIILSVIYSLDSGFILQESSKQTVISTHQNFFYRLSCPCRIELSYIAFTVLVRSKPP